MIKTTVIVDDLLGVATPTGDQLDAIVSAAVGRPAVVTRWAADPVPYESGSPATGTLARLTQIRGLGALWDGVVNVRMPSDVGKWSCRRLPLATPEGHRFDVICCCVVSGCVSPSWVPSGADRAG